VIKLFDFENKMFEEMVKKHKYHLIDQEMTGIEGFVRGFANNSLTTMDGPCILKLENLEVHVCILQ